MGDLEEERADSQEGGARKTYGEARKKAQFWVRDIEDVGIGLGRVNEDKGREVGWGKDEQALKVRTRNLQKVMNLKEDWMVKVADTINEFHIWKDVK